MNTNFAKAFRVIRAAFGLQQAELAERIGISASQLSLIEKGRRNPSHNVVSRLSSSLEIPTSLIVLLGSDPTEIADKDLEAMSSALLRLLVNASDDQQRSFRLEV